MSDGVEGSEVAQRILSMVHAVMCAKLRCFGIYTLFYPLQNLTPFVSVLGA
jgi:hypothetical protein